MFFVMQIAFFAALAPALLALLGFKRAPTVSKYCAYLFLALSGTTAAIAGVWAIVAPASTIITVALGFPGLLWHFQLDQLSGFFLALIGVIVFAMAIYSPAYLRNHTNSQSNVALTFFTSIFIASMYAVVIAHDIFSFIFFWELMSISSFFLVAHQHEQSTNRSAAFLYLLMAHISGLLILCCFGILAVFSHSNSFSLIAHSNLPPVWASIVFSLGLLGFGVKAGVAPFHVWLPQAHPAAPSNISGLMSGIMLKVAIYGLIRLCFYLLGNVYWQWGMIILVMGIISALLGILSAALQNDLKKLLAYSSLENIGIILLGIGLALIFLGTGHKVLAALGLIAALYHCLNHAIFKTLLFFGAGAILQQTHESNLEKMGGIMRMMPFTSWMFLIGCISIAALPLGNGFVSEWLTFQAALQASALTSETLRIIIPLGAAALALTGALAAACFVKVYGIAFLGEPRSNPIRHACDPSLGMRTAMGILAAGCITLGVLPAPIITIINKIPFYLFGSQLLTTNSWLWLSTVEPANFSYSPTLVALIVGAFGLLGLALIRALARNSKTTRSIPWACGFGTITPRMQYTATAFSMPLRRIFKGAWNLRESLTKTNSTSNYQLQINDWIWHRVYEPLTKFAALLARLAARAQGGNVRIYIAYTFITLILLLWIIA